MGGEGVRSVQAILQLGKLKGYCQRDPGGFEVFLLKGRFFEKRLRGLLPVDPLARQFERRFDEIRFPKLAPELPRAAGHYGGWRMRK